MPGLYVMSAGCIIAANFILLVSTIVDKPWLLPRRYMLDRQVMRELFTSGSSFLLIPGFAAVVVVHFTTSSSATIWTGGSYAVQRHMALGRCRRGAADADLSGSLARIRRSLCSRRLWMDSTYVRHDGPWRRDTQPSLCRRSHLFRSQVIRLWAGPPA